MKTNENQNDSLRILFVEDSAHPLDFVSIRHLPEWQRMYVERMREDMVRNEEAYTEYGPEGYEDFSDEVLVGQINKNQQVWLNDIDARDSSKLEFFRNMCFSAANYVSRIFVETSADNKELRNKLYSSYLNSYYSGIASMVSGKNVDVDTALDADTGLEKVTRNNYDIVVTDLGLPYKKNGSAYIQLKKLINKAKFDKDFPNFNREELTSVYNNFFGHKFGECRSHAGNVIAKKAKEMDIPAYISTNIGHYEEPVFSALATGSITLEQYEKIQNALLNWNLRRKFFEGKDKKCARFGDNFYITAKGAPSAYGDVFEAVINDYKQNHQKEDH